MSIALVLLTATGRPARLGVTDPLEVDSIEPRVTSTDLEIGSTLASGAELVLAAAGRTTRVLDDLIVAGDLLVEGTTTTIDSETVLIADNHLFLNNGYTLDAPQTGGLVVNVDPEAATNDTVNGAYTASPPAVTTTGSAVFAVGDIVMFAAGNDQNEGLFEVLSHIGTALILRGIGGTATVEDFTQNQFVAQASDSATITKVAVAVMRAGTDGLWETAFGSTTPLSFTDLGSGAGNDSQDAYNLDPEILVSSTVGPIDYSNAVDTTDVLQLIRTFVGAGNALTMQMGPGGEAVTGRGLDLSSGAGMTGILAFINNLGSGDALNVQDGGTPVLRVLADGTVQITAQGASTFSALTGNLTLDAIGGELVLDDVGNGGLLWSQAADRTFDATGAGEILNGATSAIGAINRLARALDQEGQAGIKDLVIENTVVVAAGNLIAQSSVTGRITLYNANADTATEFVGVALEGGTGDVGGTVSVRVALPGNFISDSGAAFTAQEPLFAPDGTGRPVSAGSQPSGIGDVLIRIGYANSATEYVVDPGPAFVL